jgi:hypothetical protein
MAVKDLLNHMFRGNCRLCVIDDICRLVVQPLAEGVRLKFQTCRALVPIVEIFHYDIGHPARDMTPQGLVTAQFPVFQGLQVQHDLQLGGLGQDSTYWYRLTAGDAVDQGTFKTGSQTVSVYMAALDVFRDGDPGSSGEMVFILAAFDAVRGHRIGGPVNLPSSGVLIVTDGASESWPLGRRPAFRIPNAPTEITLWAFGADQDLDFGVASLADLTEYLVLPARVPAGPEHGATPGGDWEFATALADVRVPEQDNGTIYRTLDTGNTGVAFKMRVEVRTGVESPSEPPQRWPALPGSTSASGQTPGSGSLRHAPQVVQVQREGHGRHLFALGPGGTLLWQTGEQIGWRRRRDTLWTRLADGLSAAAIDMSHDGRIDLVGLAGAGRAVHARLDPGRVESARLEWVDLEGPTAQQILAVRNRGDRLEIFCTDDQGYLHHRTLDPARPAIAESWSRMGGPFSAVYAVRDVTGALDVFGLTPGGELRTARRETAGYEEPTPEWTSLGGAFDSRSAILAARDPDGLLALGVIDSRRDVHVKVRVKGEWRPDRTYWHAMGNVDLLDAAAFDRVEHFVHRRS